MLQIFSLLGVIKQQENKLNMNKKTSEIKIIYFNIFRC